jgi:hypothetical protein
MNGSSSAAAPPENIFWMLGRMPSAANRFNKGIISPSTPNTITFFIAAELFIAS